MAKSPEQVVRDFSAAFERKDIDYILDMMTEDCVYANVPIPPMHGREEVRTFITPSLTKADKIEFIIVNIASAADGRTVLTERIDVFTYGKDRVSIPVMGTFVVQAEKISEWRDYADIATFVREMSAIGQIPGWPRANSRGTDLRGIECQAIAEIEKALKSGLFLRRPVQRGSPPGRSIRHRTTAVSAATGRVVGLGRMSGFVFFALIEHLGSMPPRGWQ